MNRRRLESTSLAVAAVLLALGSAAGVAYVWQISPLPTALLSLLVTIAVACALSLLCIRRLLATRGATATEFRQLHADQAGQRQQAQRALAMSELKLREVISIMPMTLFIKDPESRMLMMNKAAEQQFGFDFSVVSGNNAHTMFPPEQMAVFLANDRAAFAKGELVIQENLTFSHSHNENRVLQTFKKPIFDAVTGEPDFLICMSVDTTDRKRAEQALQASCLQLRQLMAHLDAAKDETHRRLAAAIHDELGQNLIALKIDIEMLHTRAGDRHPRLRGKAGHALDTVNASIGSVRAIINELHPNTLALGLTAALEWLVGQFEAHSGIATTLSVSGADAGGQDPRRTAGLFYIVRETLIDILQHARAMQVEVTVAFRVEQLAITIVDDGVVSAQRAAGDGGGFGLRGIGERVAVLGGQMLVERRGGGAGTSVVILMPAATGAVELAVAE
ncbi:PAS domain-containing sensor histidine kinase [Massilia sp. TWR1-2-2]|uniref:PAS domain-containing sensor histidine kinase n=1 Tax=Massilia sp. TWR1-2-2 TaxID=2804584 RepID=UPI003CEE70F4